MEYFPIYSQQWLVYFYNRKLLGDDLEKRPKVVIHHLLGQLKEKGKNVKRHQAVEKLLMESLELLPETMDKIDLLKGLSEMLGWNQEYFDVIMKDLIVGLDEKSKARWCLDHGTEDEINKAVSILSECKDLFSNKSLGIYYFRRNEIEKALTYFRKFPEELSFQLLACESALSDQESQDPYIRTVNLLKDKKISEIAEIFCQDNTCKEGRLNIVFRLNVERDAGYPAELVGSNLVCQVIRSESKDQQDLIRKALLKEDVYCNFIYFAYLSGAEYYPLFFELTQWGKALHHTEAMDFVHAYYFGNQEYSNNLKLLENVQKRFGRKRKRRNSIVEKRCKVMDHTIFNSLSTKAVGEIEIQYLEQELQMMIANDFFDEAKKVLEILTAKKSETAPILKVLLQLKEETTKVDMTRSQTPPPLPQESPSSDNPFTSPVSDNPFTPTEDSVFTDPPSLKEEKEETLLEPNPFSSPLKEVLEEPSKEEVEPKYVYPLDCENHTKKLENSVFDFVNFDTTNFREHLEELLQGPLLSTSQLCELINILISLNDWSFIHKFFSSVAPRYEDEKFSSEKDYCEFALDLVQLFQSLAKKEVMRTISQLTRIIVGGLLVVDQAVITSARWDQIHLLSNVKNPYFLDIMASLLSYALFSIRGLQNRNPGRLLEVAKLTLSPELIQNLCISHLYDNFKEQERVIDFHVCEMLKQVCETREGLKPKPHYLYTCQLADIYYERNDSLRAIRTYLEVGSRFSAHFAYDVPATIWNAAVIQKLIDALRKVRKFTESAIFCQFLSGISYDKNFVDELKSFNERYLKFFWEESFLEVLLFIAHWNEDENKEKLLLNLFERGEMNICNPPAVRQQFILKCKSQFLKQLYGDIMT